LAGAKVCPACSPGAYSGSSGACSAVSCGYLRLLQADRSDVQIPNYSKFSHMLKLGVVEHATQSQPDACFVLSRQGLPLAAGRPARPDCMAMQVSSGIAALQIYLNQTQCKLKAPMN
jgi:hypothetical protein